MKELTRVEAQHSPSIREIGSEAEWTSKSAMLSFVDLISENRRLLMWLTVGGIIVSAIIAFLIPSRYESSARLMPPDQTTGFGAAAMAALSSKLGDSTAPMASDLLGLRTTGATVIGVLNSRTVQDDLINQFDLRKVYRKKLYEDARKVLERRTSLGEDRKSGIITIKVEDHDPQRSMLLARAYIDELNNRVSQLSTSSARRERVFLEQRLTNVKRELDEASLAVSEFSSKNKTFDPEVQGKAVLEAAATLKGQLIAAETELSGLRQIYGPENSRVRAASARVAELRSKMSKMSGSPDDNGKLGEHDPYPSLEQLPLLGNTYLDLYRRAKIDETLYETLTKQYEIARVEEAKEIPTIKVLDEPVVPERKSWPPRLLIIILGTLCALSTGFAVAAVKKSWSSLDSGHPYRLAAVRIRGLVPAPKVVGSR